MQSLLLPQSLTFQSFVLRWALRKAEPHGRLRVPLQNCELLRARGARNCLPGNTDTSHSEKTMNDKIEFALRALLIGVGATLAMDLWAAVLRRFGVPSLNFAFLGRWVGHLPEGRWVHEKIAAAAPVKGELLIGWVAHYSIGVTFAALLLGAFGLQWARSPSLLPALFVGLVTVVAPLFILQPALGLGIASLKTPAPLFNALKSVATHAIFGLGLYLSALATAALVPAGK